MKNNMARCLIVAFMSACLLELIFFEIFLRSQSCTSADAHSNNANHASESNLNTPNFRNRTGAVGDGRIKQTIKTGADDTRTYLPAYVENYAINNANLLGYNTSEGQYSSGCAIWTDPNASTIYNDLNQFIRDLQDYNDHIDRFTPIDYDLRERIGPECIKDAADENCVSFCNVLSLGGNDNLIDGIFSKSKQLSLSQTGYVEPLLPPLRHPSWCFKADPSIEISFDISYLVHDFTAMCRKLKKASKIIFIDMGGSLVFHWQKSPALILMELYDKFGFKFDHIYAYEMNRTDPGQIYNLLPERFMSSYHWINVPVSVDKADKMNPLKMILDKYNKDDIIIVKLDIDTPSLENPLIDQLLENPAYGSLVDHLYFEHHVHLTEMENTWLEIEGSVKDSLELFSKLRQKGIAAHYWI